MIIETAKNLATPAEIDQGIGLTLAFFQFNICSFDYSPVTSVCDTLELSKARACRGSASLPQPAPAPPLSGCVPPSLVMVDSTFKRTRCSPLLANWGLGL